MLLVQLLPRGRGPLSPAGPALPRRWMALAGVAVGYRFSSSLTAETVRSRGRATRNFVTCLLSCGLMLATSMGSSSGRKVRARQSGGCGSQVTRSCDQCEAR